ncbi:CidA/LrgA family holin-like protein [Paenibacillus filicis]|uniref:CidA/LrgA family holin-like protein n=1 Tax=Paenibacillus gyeongsangnamensis TaxID=3388067 RepID=A0ABT4Q2N6_9BACL|nr:CidA/LrgA family holin-like protein [Paenibacillus filicis]MCZ8511027.1 CidA/LrgA family holin-like protein [Paenibacillus filicis]
MKSFLYTAGQVIFFMAVSFVMNQLAAVLRLPVPGSILGLLCVFILLQTKVLRLEWIDSGAQWLLAEMLLFFIPSAVGVLPYSSLLLSSGMRIGLVILTSTIFVMVCAGLIAQALARRNERSRS